jgi:hypothetical protein
MNTCRSSTLATQGAGSTQTCFGDQAGREGSFGGIKVNQGAASVTKLGEKFKQLFKKITFR